MSKLANNRPGGFWTQERVDLLESMAATHNARQIAEVLGCHRNAVLGKAFREHIPLELYQEQAATNKEQKTKSRVKVLKNRAKRISAELKNLGSDMGGT